MFFLTLYSGVKGWGASGYIKEKTRNAVENKTNTNEKQHKRNTLKYSGNTELLVLFRVFFYVLQLKTGSCENVFSVRKTCIFA